MSKETNRPKASVLEFVKVWNSCSELREFAEKTGYRQKTASTLASRLRKKGFNLKRFSRRESEASILNFVEVWNSCSELREFTEKTNIKAGTAEQKASHLRRNGFELKYFSGRRSKAEIQAERDELNFYNGVVLKRTGAGRYKAIAQETPYEFVYNGSTEAKAKAVLKQEAADAGFESALSYLIAMSKLVDEETSIETMLLREMHTSRGWK